MRVYGTLMTMLADALAGTGVNIVFGEENINAQDIALPMVCVVPVGGPFYEPGYIKDLDPNIEMLWATTESVDLYLWGYDLTTDTPVAHADATDDLRQKILQAFQNQRPEGLYFKPVSGRWAQMQQASIRYGRAYVLSVSAEIGISDVTPVEATVITVTETATLLTGS